jgi:hypothetical protein
MILIARAMEPRRAAEQLDPPEPVGERKRIRGEEPEVTCHARRGRFHFVGNKNE